MKIDLEKSISELDVKAINKLESFANNYVIVAFSAEWCKDCAANIPVLALISESTGLEVRIFGGLKKTHQALTEDGASRHHYPRLKDFRWTKFR
jgi:thiol-disulfide isomerase/thioredoxin